MNTTFNSRRALSDVRQGSGPTPARMRRRILTVAAACAIPLCGLVPAGSASAATATTRSTTSEFGPGHELSSPNGTKTTEPARLAGPSMSSAGGPIDVALASAGSRTVHPAIPFDNPRCTTPSRCYSTYVSHSPVVLSRCQKMAIANGLMGAGAVAATTTPVNWPGVLAAGTLGYAGTLWFCYAGWY